jgi:HEAT repeat protein
MENSMRTITIAALALAAIPMTLRADQTMHRSDVFDPVAEAPEAWSQQDPADSLYREARGAMNRGEHERAADLFHRIWDRYPRSAYAPDAPYWEAFNRYRIGDTPELDRALELLEVQEERYAEASTRENGDAAALRTRIRGMLARHGDESAAQDIVAAANEIAGLGARIGAEVAARMEVVAEQMEARGEILAEEMAAIAEHGVAIGAALGSSFGTGDIPQECREQAETQLAALNALLHMNSERAIPVLEKVMARRDECSTPLRRRAVFLIADQQSPEAVDMLLEAARTDPDVEVRRQAVFWLSEVDDPRAVDALDAFLTESDDDKIRERAIFALSQHDSPRAREILRRTARNESMPVRLRSKAIFWLGSEGRGEDVDFLKGLFGELDRELDERILLTVGQAGRPEDARWLLSIAGDRNVDVELRRSAVFWAAEAGAPAGELGNLYDRIQDRELKERILYGLSESGQPGAVDRLIQIARSERDPELRKKAIFWLGNSNDPRAADVLLEVLSEPQGGGQ